MMEHYVGTKIIKAEAQAHADGREGYTVEYSDGYTSWSPKRVFESAYLPIGHVGHLPEFVQRLVGEKAQNDDRLTKLDAFLASANAVTLTEESKTLMDYQVELMRELSLVFGDRLALLIPKP